MPPASRSFRSRTSLSTRLVLCAVCAVLCAPTSALFSQLTDTPFPAPIANPFEGRIGTMVQFGEADLRLDIGASLDLLEPLAKDSTQEWLTVGADFMTYTRLRSEGNFKFPVETVDYWFGLNTKWQLPSSPAHLRLRVAHISSHLVDGLADSTGTISPKPFVYSREFAELLFGWHMGALRPYAGFTAMWASQPKSPERFWPQAGIDAIIDLGSAWSVRAGYDWKLIGIDGVWAPQHAAQAGLAYTPWMGRGLALNLYGYDGRSMHGMFYTTYDSYIGMGLQILY